MSDVDLNQPIQSISQHLNTLTDKERHQTLFKCCGSERWATRVCEASPFASDDALFLKAKEIWHELSRQDYLEAFSHHPQIGADPEQLREKFKGTHQWASHEQSGMREASEACIQELAQRNREYYDRFGYIFIVCATGKTANEMLTLLKARLSNAQDTELLIAANEQAKITQIRLEKLTS